MNSEQQQNLKLLKRFPIKDIILKDKDFYSRLVKSKEDRGSILKGI